jgi:hypothetical protein
MRYVKPNLEFGRFWQESGWIWQEFGGMDNFKFKANDDLVYYYPLLKLKTSMQLCFFDLRKT